MQTAFNLPAIINIVAIGQALILAAIYLARGKSIGTSGKFLIPLLLIFSFDLFHDMLVHTRLFYSFPHLLGTGSAFTYLKGPLIFFYVTAFLRPNQTYRPIQLLHLVPFVFKHFENWALYSQSRAEKIFFLDEYYQLLDSGGVMGPDLVSLYSILWHFHPLIYLALSLVLIRKQLRDPLPKKVLTPIRRVYMIIWIYLAIWIFNVSTYYLSGSVSWIHGYYWEFATSLNSLAILTLAYVGLKDAPPSLTKSGNKAVQKQSSAVFPLSEKLEHELRDKKAYLDTELSLPILAERLSTTTHQLSELLNQHLHTTFFDYINQFRVEEAKRLIISPESDRYTLEAIAKSSGFNSAASFYRAFKKFTDTTPKQFKKDHRSGK